jgi:hypothetical protein
VHRQGFQSQTAFSRRALEPLCGHDAERQRRGEPAGEIRSAAKDFGSEEILVPSKGLEPPHPCGYMDLNHARLPIPPRWPGYYSGSFRHFDRSGTDAATTRPLQERTAFLFYRRIDLCQTHRATSLLAPRQLFKSPRRLPGEAESLKPAPILPTSPSS